MNQLAAVLMKDTFFGSHPGAAGVENPTDFISSLLPNIYILAAIILLLYLIFGGLTMIMSGGNPENAEKGQQAITNAIIGFVIIFASYWIIQFLEFTFGITIFVK